MMFKSGEHITSLVTKTQEELLQELSDKASANGANAIIGLRIETSSYYDGLLVMIAYGTAIKYAS